MPVKLYWRALRADWRAAPGRLLFFVLCLAVGVAAVVAVATHAGVLDGAIRREARSLLAADLAVTGSRPIPTEARSLVEETGARLTETRELATIVNNGRDEDGSSLLAELKAVGGGYPFYGRLESDPSLEPAALSDSAVLVAPDLLTRLGLEIGDDLQVGGEPFEILGVLQREPDHVASAFSLGPRVMMTLDGLGRTQLEQFGSRIGYKLLVAWPGNPSATQREEWATSLRESVDTTLYRVESYADAQPGLRSAIARASRFVGLVALVSLLLGGVGVAYTLQSWLAQRIDDIAVLRCLGWRPRQVVSLYVLQSLFLGLVGSAVGAAAGVGVAALAPRLAGEWMPVSAVSVIDSGALVRGMGLGVGIALLFTLPPVLAVRSIKPLRVLRREVEPVPVPGWLRIAVAAVLALGVWLAATVQSASARQGALFAAGVGIAVLVLTLLTRFGLRAAVPVGGRLRTPWIRQGFLNLVRPGAATVSACVALGLGLLLVLGMRLVELGVTDALRTDLSTEAPSAFLVDIQPNQWSGVRDQLTEHGGTEVESVPVISARLRSVGGEAVEDLVEGEGRSDRRWGLTREQRLTTLAELPPDNRVVEGVLWGDPTVDEATLEIEFAQETGIRLGDRLVFEVQGVPVEVTVTSLRTVDWQTFGLNFFVVVEPGVLDDAPQMRVATVRLPEDAEQQVQDAIAAEFPNVTLLRVRSMLSRVAAVLERLSLGIRFLGGFTVLAGVVILASAVSAAAAQRSRETALLKTLGMTRWEVLGQSAVELVLVGTLAAAVGAAGGNLLAWAVLTRGMELPWSFDPSTTLIAVVAIVATTTAAALAASWPALATRPMAVLQGR